jgi:hypothetical protein
MSNKFSGKIKVYKLGPHHMEGDDCDTCQQGAEGDIQLGLVTELQAASKDGAKQSTTLWECAECFARSHPRKTFAQAELLTTTSQALESKELRDAVAEIFAKCRKASQIRTTTGTGTAGGAVSKRRSVQQKAQSHKKGDGNTINFKRSITSLPTCRRLAMVLECFSAATSGEEGEVDEVNKSEFPLLQLRDTFCL